MFGKLGPVVRATSNLAEAQVELAALAAQRALLASALLLVGALVAFVALLGVLAAVVVLLSPEIGAGWALLLVSGIVVVGAGLAAGVAYSQSAARHSKAADDARRRLNLAKKDLSQAAEEAKPSGPAIASAGLGAGINAGFAGIPGAEALREKAHELLNSLTRNPALLIGGAFAALALLGTSRIRGLIRMATIAATLGGVAGKVKKETEKAPSPAPTPPPPPPPRGSGPATGPASTAPTSATAYAQGVPPPRAGAAASSAPKPSTPNPAAPSTSAPHVRTYAAPTTAPSPTSSASPGPASTNTPRSNGPAGPTPGRNA